MWYWIVGIVLGLLCVAAYLFIYSASKLNDDMEDDDEILKRQGIR